MSSDESRRLLVVAGIKAIEMTQDNADDAALVMRFAQETQNTAQLLESGTARQGGVHGRPWQLIRNDPMWFFRYALQQDYVSSPDWRAMFRLKYQLFVEVCNVVRSDIEGESNAFRQAMPAEKKLAAFLMYTSSVTYRRISSQLGMGTSSVFNSVRSVSRAICAHFGHVLKLPNDVAAIGSIMDGFERIAGLTYCVGAIDGTHVPWKKCPQDQFYEYRCYKGFQSIVVLALSSADRRIIYAYVGNPGVMSDSTLYERSKLHHLIQSGMWCGQDIPSMKIGGVDIRPYIMGDGAFALTPRLMKTCSRSEMESSAQLAEWEKIASATRKPVECAFGMLKNRFTTLMNGVMLEHEDDAVYFITACIILHNMCIDIGDDDFEFTIPDEIDLQVNNEQNNQGKLVRDSLLAYAKRN